MIKQQSPPMVSLNLIRYVLQLEGGGVVTDILSYLFKF